MKRTFFDDKRDISAADAHHDASDQMCAAHGCPNIWTTLSTKLCRWHSAAKLHDWPVVTEELQQLVADRAIAKHRPAAACPALTREDKTAVLQQMRHVLALQRVA